MSTYERRCHHDIDSALSHPPDLPEEQMQSLVDEIKDYQITHGSLIKLVRHEEPHTVPAIPIGVSRTASTQFFLFICCPSLGRLVTFPCSLTIVKHAVCYSKCLVLKFCV